MMLMQICVLLRRCIVLVKDDRRYIVPVLLEHGVGPQMTALKLAVLRGGVESMVRLPLDGGLKVSEYGYAVLYTAKMKGDRDMARLVGVPGCDPGCTW